MNYQWKNEKTVIVFGNEVDGVQQNIINMADLSIEIPQWGTKHSFNISVSAGIILWDLKSNWFNKQIKVYIFVFKHETFDK